MRKNKLKLMGLVSAIALLGIGSFAQAGKIISIPTPSSPETLGFGGWNLDNIEVEIVDESDSVLGSSLDGPQFFDPSDGSYHEDYFTFNSYIYSESASTATSTPMGVLHGKDLPVGEPSGIKVINDDLLVKSPKPTNCIVTTSYVDPNFLDTATPEQTICSSGFQTHKRFKVNMLENSLDTNGGAVDLVFNVEADGSSRDYQLFQKMNNYTGSRLEGFTVQVGTGVGADFKLASDVTGLNSLLKLSISAPLSTVDPENGIWAPEELATFSHGLFGAEDKHFPEDGFFDSRPAGYLVAPAVQTSGTSDTLTSGAAMPNNYAQVPPSVGPVEQFGPWLHFDIAPSGVFFDDDNDPATDAQLLAFWGDTGGGNYEWMFGNNNVPAFGVVDAVTLNEWASDPVYFVDIIEDMLNLGLNYVVTVGTVDNTWPTWGASVADTAEFTIRMIPIADTSGIGDPGYVANPAPPLGVTEPIGVVTVSPSPEFNVGDPLIVTLADGDTDLSTIAVVVENLSTGEVENAGVTPEFLFTEVEGHSGLYQATLATIDESIVNSADDNGIMFAEPGDTLLVTYTENTLPGGEDTAQTTASGMTTFFVVPTPGGGAAVFDL